MMRRNRGWSDRETLKHPCENTKVPIAKSGAGVYHQAPDVQGLNRPESSQFLLRVGVDGGGYIASMFIRVQGLGISDDKF